MALVSSDFHSNTPTLDQSRSTKTEEKFCFFFFVCFFNPFALKTAKTLWSFGRSECKKG